MNIENEFNTYQGSFGVPKSYFCIDEKSDKKLNTNTACFAGIRNPLNDPSYKNNESFYLISLDALKNYKKFLSEKAFKKLLSFINVFTNCEIIENNGEKFIKYTFNFNKKYDLNLFFLNFIRIYWNSTAHFSHSLFEKEILKTRKIKDKNKMMIRLTGCFKDSLVKKEIKYQPGHSNVSSHFKIIDYSHFISFEKKNIQNITELFK